MNFYHSKTKYGNKKTEFKGEIYDSKKEANYALQLELLKNAKDKNSKVISWERQVPFLIVVNNIKICKYIADFKVKYANGSEEIVDVKGVRTSTYILKKKLVEALYPVKIIEI